MITIYPHGFITIRKIEKMVDDPKHWQVFAENKITKERVPMDFIGIMKFVIPSLMIGMNILKRMKMDLFLIGKSLI